MRTLLSAILSCVNYVTACEMILDRWTYIVSGMQLQDINVYMPFAQGFNRLATQLCPEYPIQPNLHSGTVDLSQEAQDTAQFNSWPAARTKRGKGRAHQPSSSVASMRGSTRSRRPDAPVQKPGGKVTVTLSETSVPPKRRKLDCPVHKYLIMVMLQSSQQSSQASSKASCSGGCKSEYMNGVRHHLKSSEIHREFFSVLRTCARCQEDVIGRPRDDGIDDQVWTEGGHNTGTCTKRDRESLIIRWARLYLAIFPMETSVPHPYIDENSWLPHELIAPLLPVASQTAQYIQGSALADRASALPDDHHQQAHHQAGLQGAIMPEQSPIDPLAYVAAEETILNDVLNMTAWFLAADYAKTARGYRSVEEVVVEFRARLEHLRWQHHSQVQANGMTNSSVGPMFTQVPVLSETQSMSIPINTRPSMTHPDRNSFLVTNSSQTSQSLIDDGSNNHLKPPYTPMMRTNSLTHSDHPLGSPALEAGPSLEDTTIFQKPPHDTSTWWTEYDILLDEPGSSRMPDIVNQMNQEAFMRHYPDIVAQSGTSFYNVDPGLYDQPGQH